MYTNCKDLVAGKLEVGPFIIMVHHTPGHSAGSVCLEIGGYLLLVIPYLSKMWEIPITIKSNPRDLIISLKYINIIKGFNCRTRT